MRRYRSIVKMGAGDTAVRAGEEFEAEENDPRVRSGFVTPLPDETPDPVAAAFDQHERASGDGSDPRGDAPAPGSVVGAGEVTGDGSGEPEAPIDEAPQPRHSRHR